jgi:hypothetical protein
MKLEMEGINRAKNRLYICVYRLLNKKKFLLDTSHDISVITVGYMPM